MNDPSSSDVAPPNVLLHVGWPRTGTTTLQACLTSLAGNVGRPWAATPDGRAQAVMLALERDDQWKRTELVDYLAHCRRSSGCTDLVLSDEALVGSYASARLGHVGPLVVADRLHDVVPEAQVWVTLREPRGLLRSTYLHGLAKGYGSSYDGYLHEVAAELDRPGPWRMALRPVVDGYAERFGADRVILTTLEDLVSSPTAFWPVLAQRTGMASLARLGERPLPHENAARSRRPPLDAWLNRWALSPSWDARGGRRPSRTRWNSRLARVPIPKATWPDPRSRSLEDDLVAALETSVEQLTADYGSR